MSPTDENPYIEPAITVALAVRRGDHLELVARVADVVQATSFAADHHLDSILLDNDAPSAAAFTSLATIRAALPRVAIRLVPALIDLTGEPDEPVLVFSPTTTP